MAFTNAWDETAPAGSDSISKGDDEIRQMKLDLRERLNTDHYWPSADVASTGYHRPIHLPEEASDPTNVANAGIVYTKEVAGITELFFEDSDGTVTQITSGGSLSGVASVPAGGIILWTGASCPSGYSRFTDVDDKFLVSGATYAAAAGGSNTHTHTGPSHSHSIGASEDKTEAGGGGGTAYAQESHTHGGSTGSDGTGATGSTDGRPEYATLLLCKKN